MKPVEVTVNGTAFLIQRMDAFEALAAFGDLQKDILPAIGGAFGALQGENDDQAEAAMADAIAKLSKQLDGKQLKYWADRLLSKERVSVEIEGDLRPLDAATRAEAFDTFADILELMFHVIKLEFAGPLAGWLARLGLDPGLMAKKSLSARTGKK